MPAVTHLTCDCGKVRLDVASAPIIVAECHCNSCRAAAVRLDKLAAATLVTEPSGGTNYALYRKDRVQFLSGKEHLAAFRLTPKSPTRRVVAACCNTPIFLEFEHGHWLSLYGRLWPKDDCPKANMRTMTGDLAEGMVLPSDIPSFKAQSFGFFARLVFAWAAMGFRSPKIAVANEISV